MPKLLTKSKYLQGLESDCLLWKSVNNVLPPVDEFTQAKFDAGKEVGELAKKLFVDGVDLGSLDFNSNLDKTKELVSQRKIIFEAGFLVDDLFSRADILVPTSGGKWDVIEVKSSTSVKSIHLQDIAFQKYVYEKCGLNINRLFIMHVNKDYVLNDVFSVKDFFVQVDVTPDVNIETVEANIAHMKSIISLEQCPPFDHHDIIKTEYGNPCVDEFYSSLPDGSIFELYNGRKKNILSLFDSGVTLLKDASDEDLNEKQLIQKKCAISQEPFVDKEKIKSFIDSLTYPIYHLDFETFSPVVPLFTGTKPNAQIPFQYSLHIEADSITHKEFLFISTGDPREEFVKSLLRDLGDTGTILVYNQAFELARLKELAVAFPTYSVEIENVISRITDLLVPFRSFSFYSPLQKGSCSIKQVLPVFSSLSYTDLTVSNGTMAMNLYYNHFVRGLLCSDKEQLMKDLLEYCKQDTYGMVLVLDGLRKVCK